MNIQTKQTELQQRRGKQKLLESQLRDAKTRTRELKSLQRVSEQAQVIIQQVAQQTQQELQYKISNIVSLAMAAVFPDPYEFEIEFVIRRGKTEADLWFVRDGERLHPLSATGGGTVDVACFALRVVLWSLQHPRSRATLLLDEPFKFLSTDLQPRAVSMIKNLSSKLGIQIIMVSHVEDLIEGADRVFKTNFRNKVTTISVI